MFKCTAKPCRGLKSPKLSSASWPDFVGVGLEHSEFRLWLRQLQLELHAAPLGSVPFSPLSFSGSHVLGSLALSFSTKPQNLQLRGTGKGTTSCRAGMVCQADPIPAHFSLEPRLSASSCRLLTPHPRHDVGGTELNSARNSSPFLYYHNNVSQDIYLW